MKNEKYLATNLVSGALLWWKKYTIRSGTRIFSLKSAQKYLPFWISGLVLDQNHNSGFGQSLQFISINNKLVLSRTVLLLLFFFIVGRPIFNSVAYVLDKEMQPVPLDTIGQLYISSANLCDGYVGTKHKNFMPNKVH